MNEALSALLEQCKHVESTGAATMHVFHALFDTQKSKSVDCGITHCVVHSVQTVLIVTFVALCQMLRRSSTKMRVQICIISKN